MDLNGRRLSIDHDGDHFIAGPEADAADPQPPHGALSQPGTAIGAKDRVGNCDRSRSAHADHADRAPAFGGQHADAWIFDF
jgi:hypothetical protein